MEKNTDILIIGGGPAGVATALALKNSDLSIILVDKDEFPRSKVCGDALSTDVLNQIEKLSSSLRKKLDNYIDKREIEGINLSAPNNNSLKIRVKDKKINGYVIKRYDFDNLLMDEVKNQRNVEVLENTKIVSIKQADNHILASGENISIKAKIIVRADGAISLVNNGLRNIKPKTKNYQIAAQSYYKNINFKDEKFIELFLFPEILPGYFWIFPMNDNLANVGVTIMAQTVKKKQIKPKNQLNFIINKYLKDRFKDAELFGDIKVKKLPLASTKFSCSAERLLFVGDAASLIDPLLGEGIANAIRSGRIAAKHIFNCFKIKNFSAQQNRNYDKMLKKSMKIEVKRSLFLLKLLKYPKIVNFIFSIIKNDKFFIKFYHKQLKID